MINSWFFIAAPTSSTNPDEEDIDIVGDDGNNNKNNHNNTSSNLSSSESSRDLQLHVYGPPQFTEADVLACMNEDQDESDEDKKSENGKVFCYYIRFMLFICLIWGLDTLVVLNTHMFRFYNRIKIG